MAELAGTVRAYRRLVAAQARSQAQYRASFVVELTSSVLFTVVDLATMVVMFRVTRRLGGFDLRAAFLMAALASACFATADLVAGNIDRMRQRVRTGQLDTLLIRPLSALGQMMAGDFSLRRLGRLGTGLAALAVATSYAGVAWTTGRIVLLPVAVLSGTVFFIALFIAGGTLAFWWIESGEAANSFTYGGREFTTYPVTVYGGLLRHLFAYGLGFAFVSYHPSLLLLGRPAPLGLPGWLGWCSPVVAAIALALATVIWRVGIRHYRSSGS